MILLGIGVSAACSLVGPLLTREIIDHALPGRDVHTLVLCVVAIVLASGVVRLANVWRLSLTVRVGQAILFDLRNQLYGSLHRQPLRYFTTSRTGELSTRLGEDVAGVEAAVSTTPSTIAVNAITFVATLTMMLALHWQLALVALAFLPLFVLPTVHLGRISRSLRRQTAERRADLASHVQESLSIGGVMLAKLFARQKLEAARFHDRTVELHDLEVRQRMNGRWLFALLGLLGTVGPALIYLYGGWLVMLDEISIGTVIAFAAYLRQLYGPGTGLATAHTEIVTSFALFDRIFEYLDLESEIVESPGALTPIQAHGSIRFEDVSFRYGPDRLALDAVSFSVEPGQLVALVGPSGAGKTTASYLVPRLYDPTGGRVLIDDYDVRDLSPEWLGTQIGMVTQETFLFQTTIRENLLYARPGASAADLVAACKAAHIHQVIMALPDGYETVVGQRGYRLSGGEKQRLAIARVLLKESRILVFDEATSALDSESEASIQAALVPLMRGRTSLVIAHRLATILAADVILVLDDGRIVERGRHAELLAAGGLYARLYREQYRADVTSATRLSGDERLASTRAARG